MLDTNLVLLVCDGDELKAVQKGLSCQNLSNQIIALPIGIDNVNQVLASIPINRKQALLVGLGGGLSPQLQVGDVVIYQSCSYVKEGKILHKSCDRFLTKQLQSKLNGTLVRGLTIDQLVTSPAEKKSLYQKFNCEVVDMETYGVMNYFDSVAVMRVISDSAIDSVPDLNSAITSEGKLDKMKMAIAFMKEPIKASKLIKNALASLKILEQAIIQINQ